MTFAAGQDRPVHRQHAQGRTSRRKLETLNDFLASRGLGIEPGVALGGAALTRSRHAALFRVPGGMRDKPKPRV